MRSGNSGFDLNKNDIRCEYNLDLNPINSVIIFPFNSSLNLPKTFLLTKGDSSEIFITSKLFRLSIHLKSPVGKYLLSSLNLFLKFNFESFLKLFVNLSKELEISFVLLTNFGTSVVFTGNSIPFNSLSNLISEEYHIVSEIAKHYNFMSGINYELKQKFCNNQILAPCRAVGEINYIKKKDRKTIDNAFNRVDVVVDLKQFFIRLRAEKECSPEQFVSAVDKYILKTTVRLGKMSNKFPPSISEEKRFARFMQLSLIKFILGCLNKHGIQP
ncbi:hypothetical protein AGLY_018241 [Aphis glycines]|uniref:Uncharacterized protein n=1 Tax=Aphis glycines TaxID=307491 RepID=A0A6G0SUH6_APHGL|nr:hypothetical protein AGLY_018241 [Aphis glycines]